MRRSLLGPACALLAMIPFLAGCGAGGGTAASGTTTVTVGLGSVRKAAPASAGTVLPRAVPSGVPALDNVRLVVTGAGMTPMETVLPLTAGAPDPSVTLEVPNGARTFTAEAFGGGAIQFRGDNTVTLSGGSTTVDVHVFPAWRPTSGASAPSARSGHTAVWTGSQVVVFGGSGIANFPLGDGGIYDPVSDAWTGIGVIDDVGLTGHTAVWTGSRMIVWGGSDSGSPSGVTSIGYVCNPATNSFTRFDGGGLVQPRKGHTAVWTGSRMIVWGGTDGTNYFQDGGQFDPGTLSWTAPAIIDIPPRAWHTAVWTGTEMIVWGGVNSFVNLDDGARYNPAGGMQPLFPSAGSPSPRSRHTAVWTGTEMVVWGGRGVFADTLGDGARFVPATGAWSTVASAGAPTDRAGHTAVWDPTGMEMIVWGGQRFSGGVPGSNWQDGGRYDPVADRWTPTALYGAPSSRHAHTAVFDDADGVMVVWGGNTGDDGSTAGFVPSGGRYTPW